MRSRSTVASDAPHRTLSLSMTGCSVCHAINGSCAKEAATLTATTADHALRAFAGREGRAAAAFEEFCGPRLGLLCRWVRRRRGLAHVGGGGVLGSSEATSTSAS